MAALCGEVDGASPARDCHVQGIFNVVEGGQDFRGRLEALLADLAATLRASLIQIGFEILR